MPHATSPNRAHRRGARSLLLALGLLALSPILAWARAQPGPDTPLEARLQATLDDWREANGIIGVTLAVHSPELSTIALASGLADRDTGLPMTPDRRLGVGSITKTWIATLVLQLVDEGALTLDDTLDRWFPDFPNAARITVRHLLSHTSGATNYYERLETLAGILFERLPTDAPGLTPDELIAEAALLEPTFEPGEAIGYSNTNTVLLGRIVELVTGHPLHVELRNRIQAPLGLEDTFLGGDEAIPGGWGPGYTTEFAALFSETETTAALHEGLAAKLMTLPWASGALVTTAPDLVRFAQALFAGELLPEATLAEMLTPVLVSENHLGTGIDLLGGLGVWGVAFPEPLGLAVGHDGGIPGFSAVMLHLPAHQLSVVVLSNDDRMDMGIVPPFTRDVDTLVTDVLVGVLEDATGTEIVLERATVEQATYQDPQGRFALPLIGNWDRLETDGPFALFAVPGVDLRMYVLTVDTTDLAVAQEEALRRVGVTPEGLTTTGTAELGAWRVRFYARGDGQGVTPLCQPGEGVSHCLVAVGDERLTHTPPQHVMSTIQAFTLAGADVGLPSTVEAFEAYLNSFVGDVPAGLSIAIALGDEVLYARGFGMADGPRGLTAEPDTVWLWGSMVKVVTATAIMQLVDQGLVDLDAPIATYLPYVPAEYGITVRHLLTHSAGLGEDPEFVAANIQLEGQPLPDSGRIARKYLAGFTGPLFAPGSASAYSNPGFVLLGEIVAGVSGQPYIAYVQEHILAPLGMVDTDFAYSSGMTARAAAPATPIDEVDDFIAMVDRIRGDGAAWIRDTDDRHAWLQRYYVEAAHGGLIGPATDAMRFARMHLNGGELDGVRILSQASVELMREMQVSSTGDPLGFGLSWFVGGGEHPFVEHGGGGAGLGDLMRIYPDDGLAIVMMSNSERTDSGRVVDAAANVVFSLPTGRAPASPAGSAALQAFPNARHPDPVLAVAR